MTPGAISISLSSAVTSKVRSLRPSGSVELPGFPVGEHGGWIEAVAGIIDVADGDHVAMAAPCEQ